MLTPLKNKLLVDADDKITETASGLYTGKYSVEGGLRRGTVVAVGDKVRDLKVNDRVAFEVFLGNIIKHEDKEYYLLLETEILGTIEEE